MGFKENQLQYIPVSPYGCSKLFGYSIVRNYRNHINYTQQTEYFSITNHQRGSNFVTNKVVKTAVQIKLGMKNKLELGNLDSYRDWGHSKDYVRTITKLSITKLLMILLFQLWKPTQSEI
jgi:GDPmannose 4,6-dehydratase